jgi:hypothetical protein
VAARLLTFIVATVVMASPVTAAHQCGHHQVYHVSQHRCIEWARRPARPARPAGAPPSAPAAAPRADRTTNGTRPGGEAETGPRADEPPRQLVRITSDISRFSRSRPVGAPTRPVRRRRAERLLRELDAREAAQ